MEQRLLSTVTSVSAAIAKDNPSVLMINARGEAPSAGHSDIMLELLEYAVEPANGVYEFLLIGRPREHTEAKELTAVAADTFHWIDFPRNLKGIIVVAYENSLATSVREQQLHFASMAESEEENY